ncbi:MAG: hypothetical protein AABZ64_18390 [Nitrospinota bacterium]
MRRGGRPPLRKEIGMGKNVWRWTAALLIAGALAGCAAYEWRKEGAAPQEIMRDQELCERHAESIRRRAPAGGFLGSPGPGGYYDPRPGEEADVAQRFLACMEARGYRRVRK